MCDRRRSMKTLWPGAYVGVSHWRKLCQGTYYNVELIAESHRMVAESVQRRPFYAVTRTSCAASHQQVALVVVYLPSVVSYS